MFLFRSAVLAKVGCSLLIQLAHAVSVCERGFDFGAERLRGGVVLFQHRALQLVHQRVQAGLDIVQRVRADGVGEAEALGQFVQRLFCFTVVTLAGNKDGLGLQRTHGIHAGFM